MKSAPYQDQNRWIFELAPRLLFISMLLGIGLAITFLPLNLAVAGVIGSIVVGGVFLRPTWGLYLLAFAIPFGSLREFPFGDINVGAVEALSGLIVAAWLARMVAARQIRTIHPPLLVPLFLFLGAMCLSLTVTTSLASSVKEIAKWLEALAIYLFLASTGEARSSCVLFFCLLTAGSAEALLGIYQFLGGVGPEGFILFERFMRAYGTFRQPNPYAGYLGLSLPLAFGWLVADWKGLWQGAQRREWGRLLLAWTAMGSLALMGVALVMSWSRGGWVGAAAALSFMLLFSSRRALIVSLALLLTLALLLLFGGAGLLPPVLLQRVADVLPYAGGIDLRAVEVNDANWALIERMAHWQAGWDMFAAYPWRGVGIGNYAVVYPDYALPRWQDPLGNAHNYHLNIAAETGLIGFFAYLVLWLACFGQAFSVLHRARGYGRGLAIAALGVLVHLTVHNTFDNLFVHGMTVQVALVLGLLYVASRGILDENGGLSFGRSRGGG